MQKICKAITKLGKKCTCKVKLENGLYCGHHKPKENKKEELKLMKVPQILVYRVPRPSWVIKMELSPFRGTKGNLTILQKNEIFVYCFLRTRIPRDIIRIIQNMVRCETCFICHCMSNLSPYCCYCSDKNKNSFGVSYEDGKGKKNIDRFEHYCPKCKMFFKGKKK